MSFRISARTILHLGSELISSDGVAFYELIKNALDAQSPEVRVHVVCRINFDTYDQILRDLGERRDAADWLNPKIEATTVNWKDIRKLALQSINDDAPDTEDLKALISNSRTHKEFTAVIREANYIEIDDDGEGMSLDTLERVYLTIGTSHRARERYEVPPDIESKKNGNMQTERIILGEKGLGRLSAMRLGDYIEVVTGSIGSHNWNRVKINWNDFARSSDEDLASIHIRPIKGSKKSESESGTSIVISALSSNWSYETLEQLCRDHFSKLVDPFSQRELPLKVAFNGTPVPIPEFATFILEHAHGTLNVEYQVPRRGEPRLLGSMKYHLRNRSREFRFTGAEIAEMAGASSRRILRRIGPFSLEVYWFNRRVLTKIEGIGDLAQVRRLLASWAGGVALYRDGYRVNPYGGPKDDWLDLDRDAFSTSGFKLNRGQIVGRANITQKANPYLTDQTNREGLTDCPEKDGFVALLAATMEFYRNFLVDVDRDIGRSQRVDAEEALSRFRREDERIQELLPELVDTLSDTPDGRELSLQVKETLKALRDAAAVVETASKAQRQERERVMHLASIGLLIEVLAHELYRATAGGLKTIAVARSGKDRNSVSVSLRVLEAQLRTLQKRLKVLDPLSTNARQTKENFELVGWISDIVEGYASQSQSRRIQFTISVVPNGSTRQMRAVKGMFVQVIENLLSNSVHWITQEDKYYRGPKRQRDKDGFIGSIQVTIEPEFGRVTVMDDGPGIPEDRRELVFQPFFTTKRQKQGRGLGLYVAREIAEYHGGTLSLGLANDHGMINSVILNLGSNDGE